MKLCELFGMRERSYRYDDSRWPELIGIELELEEASMTTVPPYWTTHEDNSLRQGIELVLDAPYAGEVLGNAIQEYYKAGIAHNSTSRTSTHIHINMTDVTVDVLRSMFMIMYCIEDSLFNAIGESRKWSGYAMALTEMEPSRVRGILTSDDANILQNEISPSRNQERYYGFNTCMRRHGTAEFRYFPGGPTQQELESWVDFVVTVKRIGKRWHPNELIEALYDERSVIRFINENFGTYWATQLLQHDTAANILTKFSEVAAHITQPNSPDRRESLVFVTQGLVKYASKFFNDDGMEYINRVRRDLAVMTESEWQYHCAHAFELSGGARRMPTKTSSKFAELAAAVAAQDLETYDNTRWPSVQPMPPAPRTGRSTIRTSPFDPYSL